MNEWPMSEHGEISVAPSEGDGPQVSLFEERKELAVEPATLVRLEDPETSHAAARKLDGKAKRTRLLKVFEVGNATSEEAAALAGFGPADGAWKRCSDLKNLGLIAPTGTTRPGSSGREQMVLAITDAGRAALA